jgi:hypothetical protein
MVSGGEFGRERGALVELPLYAVEGWPGQRRIGSYSGFGRAGRGDGEAVLGSVEVIHSHGEAFIAVTSHRQPGAGLGPLRQWVSQNAIRAAWRERGDDEPGQPASGPLAEKLPSAARRGEPSWQDVTIPVDGQPTTFQRWAMTDGRWVAAGRGQEADLTLDSRHVPVAGLALVRVTDLPAPVMRPRLERPEPPDRQFPADTDPADDIPGHARVDLTFERRRLLTGSVGGRPVRLELNVPTHDGRAEGTIAGIPVSATWVNGDNYRIYPDVPSDLTGSFAGQPVELHATFHLEPGYFFDQGTITGHIGAEALHATVEAAAPPRAGSTRTIAADGTLGGTTFTIYATIDGPLTTGKIRGTVAGTPIRIDAARTHGPGGEQTRLAGRYQGPPALLTLTAGAFLHFI